MHLHTFLAPPLYGDKWTVSDPVRFTSSEIALRVHCVLGMARPTAGPANVYREADASSLSKIELRFLCQVAARSKITTQ